MSDGRVKRANWQYWSHMITAEVWQAVALSLGAEPMTVPGLALDCRDGEFDECPPDFWDRLEIACNHIKYGTLRAEAAGQIPFGKVMLAEFSEWALAPPRNWCLPKQFPRSPGRTATPAGTEVVVTRPSPERADEWMKANFRKGDKRDASIKECCAVTGARWRDAVKAYEQLPEGLKRRRGEKDRPSH